MLITDKVYDVLKFIALIALPALGALYFTLAGIWGLPAAEQILGTIVAVETFLGVVLRISTKNFDGLTVGTLNIFPNADNTGKTYQFEIDGDPEYELEGKDRILLNVNQTTS